MSDDTSTIPTTVLIRYANLFGALVTVMDVHPGGPYELVWTCHGCVDGGRAPDLRTARDRANTHAATCRALPPTITEAPRSPTVIH